MRNAYCAHHVLANGIHLMNAHRFILWILPPAFVLHVVEESALGFVPWAQRLLRPFGMGMEWRAFFVANGAVCVWALWAAAAGWRWPGFSLSFPVYMIWNSAFHVTASALQWELSPGTLTSLLLYIPLSVWTLYGANKDGVLSKRAVFRGICINVALLAGGLSMNLVVHSCG